MTTQETVRYMPSMTADYHNVYQTINRGPRQQKGYLPILSKICSRTENRPGGAPMSDLYILIIAVMVVI